MSRGNEFFTGKKTFMHDVEFMSDVTVNGILQGFGIDPFSGGRKFFVHSTRGSDGGGAAHGTVDSPFKSMIYAVDNAIMRASRGDVLICMPGHIETCIAAAGLDLDIAGITVIFLGEGQSQAYITFTTSASADMDIDAASITLIRPKFVAGIDSLTGPIDVNSTDFTLIDGLWVDATDVETTDCIVVTSGGTRLKIDGWKFLHGTETDTQKQSNIQLNGCDDIILRNIDIQGNFGVGCIENVTDEVLNCRMENITLDNLCTSPIPALYLDANATGTARNVKLHVASGTTYANSYGKIAWDNQCEGFSGTSAPAGDQLGTYASTSIEGEVISVGTQVTAVASQATSVATGVVSVGAQVLSTGNSRAIQVELVGSRATSIATGVVSLGTQTTAVASQATSIATGAVSLGTQTTAVASQATSVATGVVSVGAQVLSTGNSRAIQVASVGAQDTAIASQATSIATGTVSVGAQVLSSATSIGTATSVLNSTCDAILSIVTSKP